MSAAPRLQGARDDGGDTPGEGCEVRLRVGEPGSEREKVARVRVDAVDLPAEVQEIRGEVRGLRVVGGSRLTALPKCLVGLTGLQELDLTDCSGLGELPEWIGELTGLQVLDLTACSGLGELPAGIRGLTELEVLDLGGCSGLTRLPAGIEGLTGLQEL